jgi:PAS domain S-box-containing protein
MMDAVPSGDKFSQTRRLDIPPDLQAEIRRKPVVRVPSAGVGAAENRAPGALGTPEFQQLLQSVYDGALIAEADGRIVDSNSRAREALRYSQAELCRLNVTDLISGADSGTLNTVRETLENDQFILIQAHCVRKDRALFPVEIAVNRLETGGRRYLCLLVRDVTWRRKTEEMLKTVDNAIRNANTGIAIADLHGKLQYVNPAALKLWGVVQIDQMRGRELNTLFTDAPRAQEMVRTVLGGCNWTGEMLAQRADGSRVHVQVSAAGNRDADDRVLGMVLSFLDISDRKRAEEAERQTERQRVMMESLGAACHHLGQPSTVLLASLELIRKMKDADRSVVQELLDSSIEAADSLRLMLHELNELTEYRTKTYIESDDQKGSPGARILAV